MITTLVNNNNKLEKGIKLNTMLLLNLMISENFLRFKVKFINNIFQILIDVPNL